MKLSKFSSHLILYTFLAVVLKSSVQANPRFQYNLYKNWEDLGIVVFPPPEKNSELKRYIQSQGFLPVETGGAVFRYGQKRENGTYMMPEEVQKKYHIKRFIIIQILSQSRFMIGIFDLEWGLTLPQSIYMLEDLKKNIPKTIRILRSKDSKRGEG